jgi:hypothetical protein
MLLRNRNHVASYRVATLRRLCRKAGRPKLSAIVTVNTGKYGQGTQTVQ